MRDGDAESSLSAWQLIGSYDTASECESARDSLRQSGAKYGKLQGEGALGAQREPDIYKKVVKEALDRAACIATDDPRLKEK